VPEYLGATAADVFERARRFSLAVGARKLNHRDVRRP
jgi:hypothetical protein